MGVARLIYFVKGLGKIPEEAAHPIGAAALELVTEGFEEERDPYGRAWKPTIERPGQVLSDTGRLKNSWRVDVSRNLATVSTNTEYAPTHQYGATIRPKMKKALRFRLGKAWVTKRKVVVPQRRMIPDDGDLPDAWRKAFEEEVDAVLADLKAEGGAE